MLKFLRENFALKLISLVAAIVMWLYVSAERFPASTVTRVINAEVVRVGVPPQDVIVRLRAESIQVEISGPKDEVEGVADNEIKAEVDVRVARPGVTRLLVSGYRRPPNAPKVTVSQQAQRTVQVEVVARERKQVAITPLVNTALATGRKYGTPKLKPEWATVIGSAEDLKRVARVVLLIETTGLGLSADLPLKAQDKDGMEVTTVELDPLTAHVELAQPELPAMRTVPVSVNVTGRPQSPFAVAEVVVAPAQVTVTGRGDQLVQMTNVSTLPLSVEGLNAEVTRTIALQLPSGVTVRSGGTTVRVTVRVRDTSRAGG
jgi:YbbR domain-containing protein